MNKRKLQNQINEDALLREVVEDVKNEQLQQLWNKYGLYIIVGIALVLTIAISFEDIGIKERRFGINPNHRLTYLRITEF